MVGSPFWIMILVVFLEINAIVTYSEQIPPFHAKIGQAL
jgi:hypothetical protein